MAFTGKRNNSIPRINTSGELSSSIESIPLPRNESSEKIKRDIEKLELDNKNPKCVKCVVKITTEKNIHDWQMNISSLCSNYSRKLNNEIKFTVRILDDNTIGIWRIK